MAMQKRKHESNFIERTPLLNANSSLYNTNLPKCSLKQAERMNQQPKRSIFQKTASWLLLFLFAIILAWPTLEYPWLYKRITPFPAIYSGFFLIVFLSILFYNRTSAFLLQYYLRALRLFKYFYHWNRWVTLSLAIIAITSIFWYFRIQRVDSGDILHFRYAAVQGNVFFVEHAPLETVLRCWVAIIHDIWPSIPLTLVFQIQSCLYGAIYICLVAWLSSKLNTPYNFLIPLLLIITPALSLFCGYLEVYAFPIMNQGLFILIALLYLQRKISLLIVSFSLGFVIAVGFWNGIVGLGYLYLIFLAWRKKEIRLWQIGEHLLYIITPIMAALALLSPYTNPFAGFITRLSEPSLLIPLNPEAQAKNYGLFSSKHLADWANVTLLMVAIPFLLFFTRVFTNFHFVRTNAAKPEFIFAILTAFPAYIFGFLYYPVIGFPLDWDLYTFIFPSAACLGAVMMTDIFYSRIWRKRILFLVVALALISSAWVLQNALFWRYPFVATKIGPVISPVIPNFYYTRMQQAFDQNFETHLYWLGDKAMQESPGHYKEILNFMDDWTISTVGKIPPKPFDYPGWARDIAIQPGGSHQAYVFDRYGRIFRYDNSERLRWIYAPDKLIDSPVVAGDFTNTGDALLLTKEGGIYQVSKSILDSYQDEVLWEPVETFRSFIPESPGKRDMPIHLVDLAVRQNTNTVCVVDNYNRVWNTEDDSLLLVGEPSYNLVKALHFVNNQPVTIDVNNRLSYDKNQIQFPFSTKWFYPIIRDFYITEDQKGILMLDLNGKVHYTGSTIIYEDVVSPGDIIDRYIKITKLQSKDRLLLLDNRYRVVTAGIDTGGVTTRKKVQTMIEAGSYISAYNTLAKLWKKGSHFTPICYEMLDTKALRAIEGMPLYEPADSIDMVVDVLPLREDFIIMLDRWGRLIYENKGVLFLLEGSGLVHWPRSEAIDGTLAKNRVMLLTDDGQIWEYHHPQIFGQKHEIFDRSPKRWLNLNDLAPNQTWIGIEGSAEGDRIYAVSKNGTLLEIPLENSSNYSQQQLSTQKEIFDIAYRSTPRGYQLAYTSREGPASIYNSWSNECQLIMTSDFGWGVVSDITFSGGENIVLLDRYGVIHQYNALYEFSEKPYTVIMDAMAIRIFPEAKKAIWVRSNGEMRRLRMND